MQAVILAAGRGERLKPLTNTVPKALIEVDGKTLLEYSLEALSRSELREVIIVIGYLGEAIRQKAGEKYKDLRIEYIWNEEYYKSGSMYSLSKAKERINEAIVLLESDLLYDPMSIGMLLKSPFEDCVLVAKLSGSNDEVYVCVDDNKRIIDLGKDMTDENRKKAIGELVGISKFSKAFLDELFKKAEADYKDGRLGRHYEECVFATSRLKKPVYGFFCKDLIWIEIDNESDLKRAKRQVYTRLKRI